MDRWIDLTEEGIWDWESERRCAAGEEERGHVSCPELCLGREQSPS